MIKNKLLNSIAVGILLSMVASYLYDKMKGAAK